MTKKERDELLFNIIAIDRDYHEDNKDKAFESLLRITSKLIVHVSKLSK